MRGEALSRVRMSMFSPLAAAVALLCTGLGSQATAEILIATETVTGSGILDGTPFTNALVTLTGTFDSSKVHVDNPPDGFASVLLTAHPTVMAGGVSDTLTGQSFDPGNGSHFNGPFELDSTALSQTGNVFTGADIGFNAEVLILSTNTTADYATALLGPLGPLSGHVGFAGGFQFTTTSGGYFELDSASPSSSTVTITAIPEPGSLVLASLGAVSALLVAYRRRHRKLAI